MFDTWVHGEWQDLCSRLKNYARNIGDRKQRTDAFLSEAESSCSEPVPERYTHLLDRVRQAAARAKAWQKTDPAGSDIVDEAIGETFPASDPPVWTSAAI